MDVLHGCCTVKIDFCNNSTVSDTSIINLGSVRRSCHAIIVTLKTGRKRDIKKLLTNYSTEIFATNGESLTSRAQPRTLSKIVLLSLYFAEKSS